MTRVQRPPSKTERYFEWIECIFWLIPMGVVIFLATIGAVAAYLSGSLLTTGWMRLATAGRHNRRRRFAWEKPKPLHRMMIPAEAAPACEVMDHDEPPTHQHPPFPACNYNPSDKRLRTGQIRPFGLASSGCNRLTHHRCDGASAVPRFPGAIIIGQPGSGRF